MKGYYKQGGFSFELIESSGVIALYRGESFTGKIQFEVHRLREKSSIGGEGVILRHPTPSCWGLHGFTFNRECDAYAKYQELIHSQAIPLRRAS